MSAKEMFYSKDKSFSNAEKKAYAREDLIFNVTEDLLVMMEDIGISKAELAKKLGKSKSYVTQVLSGSRNMTLGSFSDICFALGFKPEIKIPVKTTVSHESWKDFHEKILVTTNKSTSESIPKLYFLDEHPKWESTKAA